MKFNYKKYTDVIEVVETFEELNLIFIHAQDCPGFCEYACGGIFAYVGEEYAVHTHHQAQQNQ